MFKSERKFAPPHPPGVKDLKIHEYSDKKSGRFKGPQTDPNYHF